MTAPDAPLFSVIVPTRARLTQLRRCLDALAGQQYPRDDFEVIVVNDGSPPLPAEELAAFAGRLTLRSIDQPWGGPATARNTGIRHARGRWIAFTDDDCAPVPDWLASFARQLEAHPEALVGGHVCNALEHDPYATASQLLVDYLYAYHARARSRGPAFFTSNNFAGAADTVRTLGGFDAGFSLPAGEDRDFCDRWQATGAPLHYCAEAEVRHFHAMTLRAFTRQHYRYGRGAWTFHSARVQRGSGPRRFEPFAFYSGLVTYPLRVMRGPQALVPLALLCWSQVVNAYGYFDEWRRHTSGPARRPFIT